MVKRWLRSGGLFGRLEAISFVTGFALMAFELVAARILAPSIGSSMYVWTSVIGVIIAALSLGYFAGGRLADRRNRVGDVAWLCLASSLMALISLLTYGSFLEQVVDILEDVRLQAVFASVFLFAPVSFLMGMVSSYLVKLRVDSLETSGRSVASLSSLNSLGGITGTFATGFILFGYVGSRETLVLVVFLLLCCSWLAVWSYHVLVRVVLSILILASAVVPLPLREGSLASIDTPTMHYEVVRAAQNGRSLNVLVTGPGNAQSAVFTDAPDELVFWYTRELARITIEQKPDNILILGGGTFTLPRYLAQQLPDSRIDVVEIDPGLQKIAEEFFFFSKPKNVNLIFKDARIFARDAPERYDVIVVDAYGDGSVPFALTTREYGNLVTNLLTERGVVAVNAIGGKEGACREVLASIDAIFRPNLPKGYLSTQLGSSAHQANYIMAFTNKGNAPSGMERFEPMNGPIYTDNFTPSDRLYFTCSKLEV